ncbi:MAG: DUF2378 family protein [Deltaproteobacteria bacterium]|nr:DUF2378 family protein [Deltaproteobacteria bacterium]
MSEALCAPNLDHPVDVDAHLQALPDSATTKGMFFTQLLKNLGARASEAELDKALVSRPSRYLPFGNYPMHDNIRLTVLVAQKLYPQLSLGRALHAMGRASFDAFAESHLGRALLETINPELGAVLRAGPRIFSTLFNFGHVEFDQMDDRIMRFTFREMPIFIETFQVGAIEGLARHVRASVRLQIALQSISHGTVEIRWQT